MWGNQERKDSSNSVGWRYLFFLHKTRKKHQLKLGGMATKEFKRPSLSKRFSAMEKNTKELLQMPLRVGEMENEEINFQRIQSRSRKKTKLSHNTSSNTENNRNNIPNLKDFSTRSAHNTFHADISSVESRKEHIQAKLAEGYQINSAKNSNKKGRLASSRWLQPLPVESTEFKLKSLIKCHSKNATCPQDSLTPVHDSAFLPLVESDNERGMNSVCTTVGGSKICFIDATDGAVLAHFPCDNDSLYCVETTLLEADASDESNAQVEISHSEPINRNQRIAVAAGEKGIIYLVNYTKNTYFRQLTGHNGRINALQISQELPGILVSGGDDGYLMVWDLDKQGALLKKFNHGAGILDIDCVVHNETTYLLVCGCSKLEPGNKKEKSNSFKIYSVKFITKPDKLLQKVELVSLFENTSSSIADSAKFVNPFKIVTKYSGSKWIYLWDASYEQSKISMKTTTKLYHKPIKSHLGRFLYGHRMHLSDNLLFVGDGDGAVEVFDLNLLLNLSHLSPTDLILPPSQIMVYKDFQGYVISCCVSPSSLEFVATSNRNWVYLYRINRQSIDPGKRQELLEQLREKPESEPQTLQRLNSCDTLPTQSPSRNSFRSDLGSETNSFFLQGLGETDGMFHVSSSQQAKDDNKLLDSNTRLNSLLAYDENFQMGNRTSSYHSPKYEEKESTNTLPVRVSMQGSDTNGSLGNCEDEDTVKEIDMSLDEDL